MFHLELYKHKNFNSVKAGAPQLWTQFGSKPSCGKTLVHDSNFHLTVLVLNNVI